MSNRITSYPFFFVPYFVPRARSARFGGARSARYRRSALRALSGPWALRAHGPWALRAHGEAARFARRARLARDRAHGLFGP